MDLSDDSIKGLKHISDESGKDTCPYHEQVIASMLWLLS
jgi:hypothetical protein